MEWVKSHQIRSKRGLARQLDQLSEIQKQREIKRDREMRDINLDLQRYQRRTTRDINEILQEKPPEAHLERRASLPAIHTGFLLENNLRIPVPLKDLYPRSPRSRRRLSIAAGFLAPDSPEPNPVPPQPSPKLRRLSIDGGLWGSSPKEALEAGGYKLNRSFTCVNRRRQDGLLFGDTIHAVTEVTPLSDSQSEKTNGNQQALSFSVAARKRVTPQSGAALTFQELSNIDPPPEFFKSRRDKPAPLLSASTAALIDHKTTANIVRPVVSDKVQPPQSPCTDQGSNSSSRSSGEATSTQPIGQHSSVSGEDKSPRLHKNKHLNFPANERGEKQTDTSSATNKSFSTPSSPSRTTSAVTPTAGTAPATQTDTSKSKVATKRANTGASGSERNNPRSTSVEICEAAMPSNRRELLRTGLSMEDVSEHAHKTTVFIHEDNAVLRVMEDGTVKAEEEIIEDREHSMFVSGRSSRRLSEPALGGYFLRELQEKAMADMALSRSIQANLPSDLVAEEDEEEAEMDPVSETDDKKGSVDISDLKISEASPELSTTSKEDAADSTDKHVSGTPAASKTATVKESSGNPKNNKMSLKEKESFDALKHRRRSDGDVLRFTKVFKLKQQRVSSGKSRKEAGDSQPENKPLSEKDKVWEAVRRCRYIRGYEPPEMEVADNTDISEFVFGHRDPRSVVE